MDPSAAEIIETLRGLAQKMEDALNAGMIKLFRRFAQQRLLAIRSLYGQAKQDEAVKGALAQCVVEDRRWMDLTATLHEGLRTKLDKVLVRRNGVKRLATAYDQPARRGQIYSRKS